MATTKIKAKQRVARTIRREVVQLLKAARDLSATEPARIGGSLFGREPQAHVDDAGRPALLLRPKIPLRIPNDMHAVRRQQLADALRIHRGFERATRSLDRLRRRLPSLRLGPIAALPKLDPRFERIIDRYVGKRGPEVRRTLASMTASDVMQTFSADSYEEIFDRVAMIRDVHLAQVVRPLGSMRAMRGRGDGPTSQPLDAGSDGSGDGINLPVDDNWELCANGGLCDKSTGAGIGTIALVLAAIVIGVGLLIAAIIEALEDLGDDKIRAEVAKMGCPEIIAISDADWVVKLTELFEGPTEDEDEQTILKVLSCLPADRIRNIVNTFGVEDFLWEFDGDEFDQLQVVLGVAGLLKWEEWNDDATRIFVNGVSTSLLAVLPVSAIVKLCRNMFEGWCEDNDENTILRLLKAQDACKVKLVLTKISFDEFDDNVDGEEWDKLETLLNHAKHVTC